MVVSPVATGSIEIAMILQQEARKAGVNFDMRRCRRTATGPSIG